MSWRWYRRVDRFFTASPAPMATLTHAHGYSSYSTHNRARTAYRLPSIPTEFLTSLTTLATATAQASFNTDAGRRRRQRQRRRRVEKRAVHFHTLLFFRRAVLLPANGKFECMPCEGYKIYCTMYLLTYKYFI